ncbi:MAG: endopeptidase La [Oligoflexia bacterium]|nr:endopeptidase La [Oligoflexia bacterium]
MSEIVVVNQNLPPVLPIVAIEGSPVLPGLMATLQLPKGKSITAVEKALSDKSVVGLILPKKKLQELPAPQTNTNQEIKYEFGELFEKGVSARVIKKILMPDDSVTLLVQGIQRFSIDSHIHSEPFLAASVLYYEDLNTKDKEIEALARAVILQVRQLSETNPFFTEEMKLAMINTPSRGTLADLVAFAIGTRGNEAQDFIETIDVKERLVKLLVLLKREQDLSNLQKKLSSEVDQRVNKIQREFFLKEQLRSIKKELGIEEDDKSRETNILKEKIAKADLPEHAEKVAKEELRRLQTIPESSPEFNLSRNYIDWIASLPWSNSSEDRLDLRYAKKVLNQDHFGLESVKERILEFLSVRKLNPNYHGTILCFVGPPGVGKTSLGKSIAKSLGREFFRFSLGGMRDEAEIKGHRRTYIGALPGKILQGLKRIGTNNPVILLDEIDKIGMSYQGDPASALLEVLDPEQNAAFLDHYLDVSFDLSKVLFIATANQVSSIPAALLDRMEIIEIPGYTLEEKERIAFDYVIPKSLEKHGIAASKIKLPSNTVQKIIRDYAREPGVRTLQQQIDKIARKSAKIRVEKKSKKSISVKPQELDKWLGPQRFFQETAERISQAGVVTGLAWTAAGGDILFIEALALPGKGELKLTGKMGDVMTESAKIALSHVKKFLSQKKDKVRSQLEGGDKWISPELWFQTHDIHLHIPAGAVPKDGPSAGVTMASSILSLVTNKKSKQKLAMTGELSLVGKVLPVGGIKEKVLAAKRSGIQTILLPKQNQKDLMEVPKRHLSGIKFYFPVKVDQVFKIALEE